MVLVFDIGGTKLRYAVSRDGKELEKPMIVSTPANDFETAKRVFAEIKNALPEDEKLETVVAGVAGPLDREHTMLVNSPHLQGWVKQPLKQELGSIFGVPSYLENDAALVGLGEVSRGAAKGYPIASYITVSTDVGGVRIVDGKIDRNALGFEPGHQIIDQGKTLAQLVSGSGVAARFGKDPRAIQEKEIWDEVAKWLAVGLNNTIVHWSPDVVVLGGAMITGTPAIPFDALLKYYKETVTIFPNPPPLKKGILGDRGGLYGALELAKEL